MKTGHMKSESRAVSHESAHAHANGEALYTDDLIDRYPHVLHAWPVMAPHAHARVLELDAAAARCEYPFESLHDLWPVICQAGGSPAGRAFASVSGGAGGIDESPSIKVIALLQR